MIETTPPSSVRLRKGRTSIPGQIYLVTTTTRDRKPVFRDFDAACHLCRVIRRMDGLRASRTLCFVVMPDHIHWLFELKDRLTLSKVVHLMKSNSARAIGRPIWQPGFHDRAIRREEDLLAVARYIVANPLRAGLTSSVREYPYWDAIWL
ncbi:MAG: transposase [Pseudomonadales bacterium]|nr:transposase [Pseudomonadales bacterium]